MPRAGRKAGNREPTKARPPARRLPAGRHGLSREFVAENQRERILTALADCVAERGYVATTVTQISKAAGVSRATFYQHFANKEACFLVAYEMVAEHLASLAREAAEPLPDWPQKVRAGLAALLGFLASEPELARLVLIEPAAAGRKAAERHGASMRRFAEMLRAGRQEYLGDERLPEAVEEALVGGIASLIVREISAGRSEQLERLLPDLLELTLVPCLGPERAARLAAQA